MVGTYAAILGVSQFVYLSISFRPTSIFWRKCTRVSLWCDTQTATSRRFFVCFPRVLPTFHTRGPNTTTQIPAHSSSKITKPSSVIVIQCLIRFAQSVDSLKVLNQAQVSPQTDTRAMRPIVWQCFAPRSDPGNHGADPSKCLQVAPFHSEGNSIWIGYHNQPSKKYLGVFPSLDEVIDRCRRNVIAGSPNTSFPRFNTTVRDGIGTSLARPETFSRHVCCTACQDEAMDCETLTLQYLAVKTGPSTGRTRNKTVYLTVHKFYMKGEQMVALLQHVSGGKHCFQKTDGTLSKILSLDSQHGCRDHSQSPPPSGREDDSDSSSLTEFDCMEDDIMTDVGKRFSCRGSPC